MKEGVEEVKTWLRWKGLYVKCNDPFFQENKWSILTDWFENVPYKIRFESGDENLSSVVLCYYDQELAHRTLEADDLFLDIWDLREELFDLFLDLTLNEWEVTIE